MRQKWMELNDYQWEKLQALLIQSKRKKGRPESVQRNLLNGTIWHLRNKTVYWRDIPDRYGKWNSIYKAFSRWKRDGRLSKIIFFAQKEGLIDA